MVKYLVIGSLLSLLILFVYSRLKPYIEILKKVLGIVKSVSESPSTPRSGSGSALQSKLVRCVSCGTWVPADRALGAKSGSSVYCSQECLEKVGTGRDRKIAG